MSNLNGFHTAPGAHQGRKLRSRLNPYDRAEKTLDPLSALLWWLADDRKLSKSARTIVAKLSICGAESIASGISVESGELELVKSRGTTDRPADYRHCEAF
jgi:hypothetical protein